LYKLNSASTGSGLHLGNYSSVTLRHLLVLNRWHDGILPVYTSPSQTWEFHEFLAKPWIDYRPRNSDPKTHLVVADRPPHRLELDIDPTGNPG
jgi:hypothetical protein